MKTFTLFYYELYEVNFGHNLPSSGTIYELNKFNYNISQNETYSFEIDYENDQFLLDGKPFRYVAGSFHYFRAPHQKWRDILRKMRQGGLNAVST